MLEVSPSRGEKEEQGSELPPANATIQGPYPPGDRKYRSRQNPTFQGELGSPLLSFLVSPQNSSLLGTRNGNCANPGKMSWVGQVPWAMGSIPARVEGCPEPPSSAPPRGDAGRAGEVGCKRRGGLKRALSAGVRLVSLTYISWLFNSSAGFITRGRWNVSRTTLWAECGKKPFSLCK